ncbi:MAG: winged helix-turn-helix transcriptional regulator [Thermoplasmatota archaeon]
MRAVLVQGILLAAVLAVGLASATPTPRASPLDPVWHGVTSAGAAVGQAASQAGAGIATAAGALGKFVGEAIAQVGQAIAALASLVGRLAMAAGAGIGQGVAWAAGALGWLLASGLSALASGFQAAGRAIGLMAGLLANGLAALLSALGALALLLWGLVGLLRPNALSPPLFDAIAATGGAASAGVAGWGLWTTLRRLGWVPGFSRIAGDEILEHPGRRALFDVVQANPGIHTSELARRTGTGWGTIVHHLDKLERGRLVVARRVNNQKCYFENGGRVSREDMAVAGALRKDKASLITTYVESHPMATQKQVGAALGMSAALTSFHVRKLANLGVLDVVRRGKETLLATSPALRRVAQLEAPQVAAVPAL